MGRFRCDDAPALIRAARADAGLTQLELARRAGLRQSSLAQMESGTRAVSARMLERVLRAADYRPSVPLAAHADEIRERALAHGLGNIRVFGSAVRGEELTGFPTDAVSDAQVPAALADAVREAVPL